jgi:formylglycine-generating enzyme required for sulfatase activity
MPVGQHSPAGDSPYGVADMAGNAWEWTSSLYKSYPYKADDGREDMSSSGSRVLRGGSFDIVEINARAASRYNFYDPRSQWYINGFRCAVSVAFSISLK